MGIIEELIVPLTKNLNLQKQYLDEQIKIPFICCNIVDKTSCISF